MYRWHPNLAGFRSFVKKTGHRVAKTETKMAPASHLYPNQGTDVYEAVRKFDCASDDTKVGVATRKDVVFKRSSSSDLNAHTPHKVVKEGNPDGYAGDDPSLHASATSRDANLERSFALCGSTQPDLDQSPPGSLVAETIVMPGSGIRQPASTPRQLQRKRAHASAPASIASMDDAIDCEEESRSEIGDYISMVGTNVSASRSRVTASATGSMAPPQKTKRQRNERIDWSAELNPLAQLESGNDGVARHHAYELLKQLPFGTPKHTALSIKIAHHDWATNLQQEKISILNDQSSKESTEGFLKAGFDLKPVEANLF